MTFLKNKVGIYLWGIGRKLFQQRSRFIVKFQSVKVCGGDAEIYYQLIDNRAETEHIYTETSLCFTMLIQSVKPDYVKDIWRIKKLCIKPCRDNWTMNMGDEKRGSTSLLGDNSL